MRALTKFSLRNHPVWSDRNNVVQVRRAFVSMIYVRNDSAALRDMTKTHDEIVNRLRDTKIYKPLENDPKTRSQELDVDAAESVDYNTAYRFLTFQQSTRTCLMLDAMALILQEFLESDQCKKCEDFVREWKGGDLLNAFRAYLEGTAVAPLSAPRVSAPPTSLVASDNLGLTPQSFLEASRLCTGNAELVSDDMREQKSTYYSSYRYASRVGQIVRSSICFLPATESDPVCRFRNLLKQPSGGKREVNGIVSFLGETIYAIGNKSSLPGLKFISLTAPDEPAPVHFFGLTLSKLNAAIAARLVLVKEEAELGRDDIFTFDLNDVRFRDNATFHGLVEPNIRNQCDFKLNVEIQEFHESTGKWEDIDQTDMVSLIGRMTKGVLRIRSGPQGANFVKFNPADHKHYPFNQAIVATAP